MSREEMYEQVVREHGRALDRLALGYEADREKRHDLRQEIHLQIWRSLAGFDGRCSLKTWVYRVAHNTAVSYVQRERRLREGLVGLEEAELSLPAAAPRDVDRERAIEQMLALIRQLKPLDRQILILYLEEMDGAAIAAITGLPEAHVGVKIHRAKKLLAQRFQTEKRHA